jgi:hypothetical protein
VTWQFKHSEDNIAPDFYWGHYHLEDEEAALKDFSQREQ